METDINMIREMANKQLPIMERLIKLVIEKQYFKDYELESRIKGVDGLKRKQTQFPEKYGFNVEAIPDILGFRVSVPSEEDCLVISEIIYGLAPYNVLDFFNNPKESGFKAFLYQLTSSSVNVEIQIMTYKMRDWTNATHEEHEQRKYGYNFEQKNDSNGSYSNK